jgi:Na+-translocating ferredoxin:NAD+ oxidoreductase subunit G
METVRMVVVLTVISAVSGLSLAAFNNHAQPIIKVAEKTLVVNTQLKKVIPDPSTPGPCDKSKPGFDNNPLDDTVCLDGKEVYRLKKGGDTVGYAFKTIGDKAYGGTITCLLGLSPDGVLKGLEIVKHAETPGLGSEIENCKWRQQLVGKGPNDMNWKVKKDGGDVDQISGATISSRSVLNCIEKGRAFLEEKRAQIDSAAPLAEGKECHAE